MTILPRSFRWRGPPLALQIMGLLLGGLIVAQAVTLLLTLVLPPEPPAKFGLDDIAAALRGGAADGIASEERDTAPTVEGRGWLVPAASRAELARLLGVAPEKVALAFYTPLPFAGTVGASATAEIAEPAAVAQRIASRAWNDGFFPDGGPSPAVLTAWGKRASPADLLRLVQAVPGPPPGAAPGGLGFPRGNGFPGSGSFPGGGLPGGGSAGRPGNSSGGPGGFPGGGERSGGGRAGLPPLRELPDASRSSEPPASSSKAAGASATIAGPPAPSGRNSSYGPARRVETPAVIGVLPGPPIGTVDIGTPAPPSQGVGPAIEEAPPREQPVAPEREGVAPREAARQPAPIQIAPVPAPVAPAQDAPLPVPEQPRASGKGAASSIAAPRAGLQRAFDSARTLLGLAPAPFVEGDFVASVRLADGRWRVVQPRSGGLLSPWQKRVALWFLLAFGITAPFGWLFARGLSRPLDRFADAAAQLGRDPSAAIAALDGPAEIGRAAHAFNLMQQRLRSFVDDRTAMVGAISHDLRTPLTRMRFRVEDAPDEVRAGMLAEMDEMEEMITSVLSFIRDASTAHVRERLDLRDLVDDVVEDAAVVGADITVEGEGGALVEVEVMGMRRVLANLLENALKYGEHPRIRLSVEREEAVAAVIDDGPGLPEEELEQVFQPFYRTAGAKASGAPGTGLGLAVCRSIARAHGGDVRLCRTHEGFRAEVRVPLAYDAMRLAA